MTVEALVKDWFEKWEEGDFLNLPLAAQFKHTSPFGTIEGKENYLSIVEVHNFSHEPVCRQRQGLAE